MREDRGAGWLLIVRALHPLINADCLNLGPSTSVLTILPLQPRVYSRHDEEEEEEEDPLSLSLFLSVGMLTRAGIVGILRVHRFYLPSRTYPMSGIFSSFVDEGRGKRTRGEGG